jgi:hypothetical protein
LKRAVWEDDTRTLKSLNLHEDVWLIRRNRQHTDQDEQDHQCKGSRMSTQHCHIAIGALASDRPSIYFVYSF